MSYSGIGSYYTFQPHEVYSGMGEPGMGEYFETGGLGAYYYDGFGALAETFSPDEIMANIAKSDVCYGPGGTGKSTGSCNFAGQQVGKEIQAALNQLGYGPLAVDGSLNWRGAFKRYLTDNGLTAGPGFGISKQALLLMQAQLAQGQKPGPGEVIEHTKVNGEYIPVAKIGGNGNGAVAGMSGGTMLLAAAVVGGLGYLAWRAGKKKKGAGPPQTKAMQLT